MWHQPLPALKYTTSVDIQKTRYKKLVTHVEPQASAVSLLKRAHQSINQSEEVFYKPREKRSLKRCVFRLFLKEERDGELRTFVGREFQILAA